jgi:hypothetical protein
MRTILTALAVGVLVLAAAAQGERWPLGTGADPNRVGNNCYEFQNYGSDSYYHDGLDCLGAAADPCYSVDNGYMMRISVSEPLYTGMMINYTNGPDKGWLYWHITANTIPFVVGDHVNTGDRVGNLANWPVSSFHHTHFTRSYYPNGNTWYDCVDNAIEFMQPTTDTQVPVFEESETGQWFSFCENNGTLRIDPNQVKGQVDVIAKISDRITDTSWRVVPYDIEWWVEGVGGNVPVTKYLTFTGATPAAATVTTVVYKRAGQWMTQGNYAARDFYFVVTNTDGDGLVEAGDEANSFDTTALPDGAYNFYVRARDWAGNAVIQSMPFTIANLSNVKLRSFTARSRREGVELAWAAENEQALRFNLYRESVAGGGRTAAVAAAPLNGEPVIGKNPFKYFDAGAVPGVTYRYWLEAVEPSGHAERFGPVEAAAGGTRPRAFALAAIAPNPVRDAAAVTFALPKSCHTTLALFDVAGRRVATPVDADMAPGEYRVPIDASALPAGVYIYRLTAGEFAAAKRMVVAK